MSNVVLSGPVAYLAQSESSVFFSKTASTGSFAPTGGTVATVKRMQTALDWKARALYGNGIVPGKITGQAEDGADIFKPLDRKKYKAQYSLLILETI